MESEQITASTFGNHKNQFCKSFHSQTAGGESASKEKPFGSRKSFAIENEDIKRISPPPNRLKFRFDSIFLIKFECSLCQDEPALLCSVAAAPFFRFTFSIKTNCSLSPFVFHRTPRAGVRWKRGEQASKRSQAK
jgi:hypothetical protein